MSRILLALWLTLPAAAQTPAAETDWRMPFRRPVQSIEPNLDGFFGDLRTMQRIAAGADPSKLRFEHGVEVCDLPKWQAAFERMTSHARPRLDATAGAPDRRKLERLNSMPQNAGYLSLLIRESGASEDRATAFYGAFYDSDPAMVFTMIEHIPGEPVRRIREDAYRRAGEYLKARFSAKNPGDAEEWARTPVGPGGTRAPRPGEFSHRLDPAPFVALLDVRHAIDRAQALWFLGECVRCRPTYREQVLEVAHDRIRALVVAGESVAREQARAFVAIADPEGREPAAPDASDDAVLEWYDAVIKSVFPPIRQVSDGLVELFDSEELDEIAAAGSKALRDGSLGETAHGTLPNGTYFRGFRIDVAPAPLDRLGLEPGTVVTALNGSPVATAADVLATLEQSLKHKSTVFVEFVFRDRLRGKEFRLHK